MDRRLYIQILQSELLVLKVLDLCLTFHWHCHRNQYLGYSFNPGSATSIGSNAAYAQGNHPSTIAHDQSTPWVDPAALSANLAGTAVALLSKFLRRSSSEGVSSDLSFHDFETVEAAAVLTPAESPNSSSASLPQKPNGADSTEGSTGSGSGPPPAQQDPYSVVSKPFALRPTYQTLLATPASLHTVVAKFAARIAFSLSASNWNAVYSEFRSQVSMALCHDDYSLNWHLASRYRSGWGFKHGYPHH
jgi:neurofibromin 1